MNIRNLKNRKRILSMAQFKEKMKELLGPTQASEYEFEMTFQRIVKLIKDTLKDVPCSKKIDEKLMEV